MKLWSRFLVAVGIREPRPTTETTGKVDLVLKQLQDTSEEGGKRLRAVIEEIHAEVCAIASDSGPEGCDGEKHS